MRLGGDALVEHNYFEHKLVREISGSHGGQV
jgi:hypothetical protein